jgi:hypothetical protein
MRRMPRRQGQPDLTVAGMKALPVSRRSAVRVLCGKPECGRPMGKIHLADILRDADGEGDFRTGICLHGPTRVFVCRVHGPHPPVSAQRLYRLWLMARLPTIAGQAAREIVL